MEQNEEANRRPLAVRNLSLTKRIAVWICDKNITPNQISLLSIVFAALALLFGALYFSYSSTIWLLLFPVAIQMRLLCNLFDGMVAVEGGKQSAAGELFNDAPDRLADLLIIMGAGFIALNPYAIHLAWLTAVLAVFTAYIRVLGVSMGCAADFRGPMAKQHRMALLTFTSLIMFFDQFFGFIKLESVNLMDIALVIMALGCVVTCWRRLVHIYQLKNGALAEKAND